MMWIRAVVLWSGALLAAAQDRKIDMLPESVEWKDVVFSPSGGAVAYKVTIETEEENKQAVVVNGKKGEAYDEIEDLAFSPNGTCAYVGKRGEKKFVVFGGRKEGPYDDIVEIVFSPDGTRVAYWATTGEKSCVVVDGKPQSVTLTPEEMAGIGWPQVKRTGTGPLSPVFSPDGRRLAYAAVRKQKMFIVVDGAQGGKEYDAVRDPAFSPDGGSIAFPAKVDGKWRVVGGEKEGEGFETVQWLIYGAKGPVYVASPGARSFVVVGDEKREKHKPAGPPVPSPDGSTAAYWAELGGGKFAVVVGEEAGEAFGLLNPLGQVFGFEQPSFLSDGRTVVYGVTLESGSHVVIGKQKGEAYEAVDDLVVSPDRKSVAFVASKDNQSFVVWSGKKSGTFAKAKRPVFAADGKSVGFYALRNENEVWWKVLE